MCVCVCVCVCVQVPALRERRLIGYNDVLPERAKRAEDGCGGVASWAVRAGVARLCRPRRRPRGAKVPRCTRLVARRRTRGVDVRTHRTRRQHAADAVRAGWALRLGRLVLRTTEQTDRARLTPTRTTTYTACVSLSLSLSLSLPPLSSPNPGLSTSLPPSAWQGQCQCVVLCVCVCASVCLRVCLCLYPRLSHFVSIFLYISHSLPLPMPASLSSSLCVGHPLSLSLLKLMLTQKQTHDQIET